MLGIVDAGTPPLTVVLPTSRASPPGIARGVAGVDPPLLLLLLVAIVAIQSRVGTD